MEEKYVFKANIEFILGMNKYVMKQFDKIIKDTGAQFCKDNKIKLADYTIEAETEVNVVLKLKKSKNNIEMTFGL